MKIVELFQTLAPLYIVVLDAEGAVQGIIPPKCTDEQIIEKLSSMFDGQVEIERAEAFDYGYCIEAAISVKHGEDIDDHNIQLILSDLY